MLIKKTPEEFNAILSELESSNIEYFIKEHNFFIELNINSKSNTNTYVCPLLQTAIDSPTDFEYKLFITKIRNTFKKMCKYPVLKDQYGFRKSNPDVNGHCGILWDIKIACGYQYSDPHYARKNLNCWAYDINSAYSFAMLNRMPDTSVLPKLNAAVCENEIGFYKFGGATIKVGAIADYVFPLIESPFKEYVNYYFKLKREASMTNNTKLKAEVKSYLNIPTGLIARENVFLRNAIIYYSNQYIKSFIDDSTVYVNIDCIVSRKARTDLPLGNNIGQFKIEHENERFKYIQNCIYQWGSECHYSGIPLGTISDIECIDDWQLNLDYRLMNGRIINNEKKKN